MVEEIFKDIKDLEGKYQVSNFGNILSLNYHRSGKPKLMKPSKNKNGYFQLYLFKDRKKKFFQVHRLVAEAFLPNPYNLPCVNHKIEGDEGKTINMVFFNEDGSVDEEKSTIEWCTHEYNNNYGTHNERSAKTRSKKVLQFTLDGEFIREWSSTNECGRNGFNKGNISSCCNGKTKSAYGYIWKYKE